MPKRKQAKDEVVESPSSKSVKLTRKSASFLSRLPVEATGALPNVVLIGCSKRTSNARVRVTGIVQPYSNVHRQIKELGEWNEFVRRCQVLPGFRDDPELANNFDKMEAWLTQNARDGSLASLGSDHAGDRIIVEKPGTEKSQFLLMGDHICDPNGFSSAQIESFIPRPEKTKAHKKHTLVLHRSGFRICTNLENPLMKFKQCAVMYDLETGLEVVHRVTNKHFVLVAPNCGVFYNSDPSLKRAYSAPKLLDDLGILIGNMDCGELKSLLQKLLRFAPRKVVMGDQRYETSLVLQAVCECSLVHPGGKSPNTGLFVRGLPSFLKRLAVTMVEDSWTDATILQELLLMSIIASNDATYFPTAKQLANIFAGAHQALRSTRAVVYYQDQVSEPLVLKPGLSHVQRASCFLDILKSFPWDLTMVRSVATQQTLKFQVSEIRPEEMDIAHYLDHHVGPEFAYFLNPTALEIARERYVASEIFGDLNDQQSKPYAILFREVFHASSGFNCRRTPEKLCYMETQDEFAKMIRAAQSRYFIEKHLKFCSAQEAPVVDEHKNVTIEVELDPMWLAAAIGHLAVRVKQQNYFVFVTQVEPEVVLGVARVPSRQQKDIEIDEDARSEVIQAGFELLQKGVPIQEAHIVFGKHTGIILLNNKLHLVQNQDTFVPDMLISSETNCDFHKVKRSLEATSLPALQRLWQLSQGFCKAIEFPKVARCGGPEDRPINIYDIEVFQLCLKLTPMLNLVRLRVFDVVQPVVWWHVRDEILKLVIAEKIQKKSPTQAQKTWHIHADTMQRTPTATQVKAMETLKRRSNVSNFVVMEAGSGKTFIIGQFLLYLAKIKQLPKHVLFVTPASAMEGVEFELRQFTDDIVVRDMTKSKKSQKGLAPGITILNQDHMRLSSDLFKRDMPETLLVADEFHLCLCQKTQRTKMMLEWAASCKQLVALSGTPTISHELYDLLPMLAPIVPFELTLKNFFVGYSYAINHKTCVDIEIETQIENIPMPKSSTKYWDLLPASLGGKNAKRLAGKDLNHLITWSQDIATLKMVELAKFDVSVLKNTVFLVARKSAHVTQMCDLLVQMGMAREDIYCILEKKDAITLTEVSIEQKKDPRMRRYKVIIAPLNMSTGYSVSIANVQISTIYPSNSANREQMRHRIKRLSSRFKKVCYVTVVCGRIQELIEFRQDKDDSLSSILKDLADRTNSLNYKERVLLA